MSALVSVHVFWAVVFIPLAGICAWRMRLNRYRSYAFATLLILTFTLLAWLGYLAFTGAGYTQTFSDRILYALNTLIGAIDMPLVQFQLAAVLIWFWPKAWTYQPDDEKSPVIADSTEGDHCASEQIL